MTLAHRSTILLQHRCRERPDRLLIVRNLVVCPMKLFLLILGILSALLTVSQLVLGILIANGNNDLRKAHPHMGYTMSAVVLVYVGFSLAALLSTPRRKDV
jgi:hypothetical protein